MSTSAERRRKLLAGLGGFALGTVTGAALSKSKELTEPVTSFTPAAEEKKNGKNWLWVLLVLLPIGYFLFKGK